MGEGNMLDIAHISFLDMIKVQISMTGSAVAKGTLIRNAVTAGEKIQEINYETFDDFLAAIDDATNPIATVEGKASYQGDFIFGLAKCPFGQSIKNYTSIYANKKILNIKHIGDFMTKKIIKLLKDIKISNKFLLYLAEKFSVILFICEK